MNIESDASRPYPVLPLRNIVVFPHMAVPLFVGREKSVQALEAVMATDRRILLVAQKVADTDDPKADDIYTVGVVATVLQLLKLPDGTVKVLVAGRERTRIVRYTERDGFLEAEVAPMEDDEEDEGELQGLKRAVVGSFERYAKINKKIPPEVFLSLKKVEQAAKVADVAASHLGLKVAEKQALLELPTVGERLKQILSSMANEIGAFQIDKKIRGRVKTQMEKTQREYYLNEQMKAIQQELGEGEDGQDENTVIAERIKKTKLSKEAREKAESELKKLRSMSPLSSEATVVRNYLDWLLAVPWRKSSRLKNDVKAAQKVLEADHYGLEKVKERILEYLAVQQRTKKLKGPILCLVGSPGVGKTSLGESIARATNRNFVRVAMGGVRDESEVRGHRRTYIGSMPGKIIQGMKKAKSSNPLFLLDELDKLGADWRGDPSSALLEVLDPEQNYAFQDHYLEVDYDLSNVMFVCTANSLRMPSPLLDRIEVIRLSGYTEEEKIEIARRHLIPKQMELHGLEKREWSISDNALRDLIRYHTREAGVRNLERELANLARKATKNILVRGLKRIVITPRALEKYSGVRKYRYGEAETENLVGVVTGLAYTEFGGDLLSIEATTMQGKGKCIVTGQLGDVMKESIEAARSYVRSRAPSLGIKPTIFDTRDIHVHVPEGAIPKDGPSAGLAMCVAIVSTLSEIKVRADIALTGEVTLRGRALAIGGLKEKLLAALRGGVKTVLIPEDNKKDLVEIPESVKKSLNIIPVSSADEVFAHILEEPVRPIEWTQADEEEAAKALARSDDATTARPH